MVKTKFIYLVVLAICWVGNIAHADAQKKYEEIYINLPTWSVDQSYSELMDYQRKDPYLANVYIQLGVISEHKLIGTDPLREIENTQFWAKNAELFWGNLKVYYKENDARHSDFYENLNIPMKGSRLTDAEVMDFVKKHQTFCKNYADSAQILYDALERSKKAYNICLTTYRDICDNYTTLNEALLCYDKGLIEKLKILEVNYNECISQFNYYKQVLKQHPLLNYRQIYDVKPIPTFRLDGLTNSDFLQNRFFIWDYKLWVDDYMKKIKDDILPLRKEIESINAKFVSGYEEWKLGKTSVVTAEPAYDDYFLFRLGRYDNNSLVRELFSYLESRRVLLAMAQDSLALPVDSLPANRNRHLRHLYRASQQYMTADQNRQALANFMSDKNNDARIRRFDDFFKKNYGSNKIVSYPKEQLQVLDNVFQGMLVNYVKFLENMHEAEPKNTYSLPSGKLPALPMWVIPTDQETTNIQGQYLTRCLDRNSLGTAAYVSGDRVLAGKQQPFVAAISDNQTTLWVSQINNASAVLAVRAYEKGCVVQIENNKEYYLVYFNDKGKETSRIKTPQSGLKHMVHNMITGTSALAFDFDDHITITQLDSLQAPVNSIEYSAVNKVEAVQESADGLFLIVGSRDGMLSVSILSGAGNPTEKSLNNGAKTTFVDLFRPSANEFCVIYKDEANKLHYEILTKELITQLLL